MSDPSPQQDQPKTQPAVVSGASGNGDRLDDPLARLHRMSRTAGLGTQEYVAINPMAVTALLLGLASALSLLVGLLLIIPLAGVVCAVVALWQVHKSSGTQSGQGLAWSGLVLSLIFAALVGTQKIVEDMRTRADRDAIMRTAEQFGQKLAAEDLAGAYAMLGQHLTHRLSADQFTGHLEMRIHHPAHGKITTIRSNGLVAFEAPDEQGNRFATTQVIVQLERGGEDRTQMAFQKVGDQWIIQAFGWFPPEPVQRARQPG